MLHTSRLLGLTLLSSALLLGPLLAGGDPAKTPPKNYLGVRAMNTPVGVEILDVLANTPASKAGLNRGDLILKIDGYDVGIIRGLEYPLHSELRRSTGMSKFMIKRFRTGTVEEMMINVREEEKKPETKPATPETKPVPPKGTLPAAPKEDKKPAPQADKEARSGDDFGTARELASLRRTYPALLASRAG